MADLDDCEASARDDASEASSEVADLTAGIPGIDERIAAGRAEIAQGEGVSLDEL